MAIKEATFVELVKAAQEYGASDIHIRENESPCFRIHGELIPIKAPPVESDDLQSMLKILLKGSKHKREEQELEFDGARSFAGVCRVRFNVFQFQERQAIVLRLIKSKIPSLEDLALSPVLKKLAMGRHGLILVTGPTGAGKSSTMAAMLNYVNEQTSRHIVTIEDPVEYRFTQNKCRITQREVGIDTADFTKALKATLRQDPDIIMIGELRDLETVDICLKAAETGHLVISTIHTNNAENTIGRLIAMFPPESQRDARSRLADNLVATISQRLIKRSDKTGLVAAQEIMLTSPGIKDCISGKDDMKNLYTYIKEGGKGSQTFNQHIQELLRKNIITREEAIKSATSSEDFAKSLDLE